jgi:hypothetical protein
LVCFLGIELGFKLLRESCRNALDGLSPCQRYLGSILTAIARSDAFE